MATVTVTYTSPGTYAIAVPPGVTSMKVRLWGGGGTGAGRSSQGTGGGGAGGQYVEKTFSVTAGQTYTLIVAAAATGSSSATVNGNDSYLYLVGGTNLAVAKGGAGAVLNSTTGAAGSTSGGIGDLVYAGGSGGNGSGTTSSGGGGGGAGTTGAGGSGSGTTAGTGTSLSGGAGGAGRTSAGTGSAGTQAGGGGGGAWRSTSTNRAGGNGAAGRGEVVYDLSAYGYTKIGANNTGGLDLDWGQLNKISVSTPVTASSIAVYCSGSGVSIRPVIYTDNSGTPGTLLAVGAVASAGSSFGWVQATISASLPAGNYWIGFFVDGPLTVKWDGSVSGTEADMAAYSGAFSSPPNSAQNVTVNASTQISAYLLYSDGISSGASTSVGAASTAVIGSAPTVKSGSSVGYPAEFVAISGQSPVISAGVAISIPSAITEVLQGSAVTVGSGVSERVVLLTVAGAPFAPSIVADKSVPAEVLVPTKSVAVVSLTPGVLVGVSVNVPVVMLSPIVEHPSVFVGTTVVAPNTLVTLLAENPTVSKGTSAVVPSVVTDVKVSSGADVNAGSSANSDCFVVAVTVSAPIITTGDGARVPVSSGHIQTIVWPPSVSGGMSVDVPTAKRIIRSYEPITFESGDRDLAEQDRVDIYTMIRTMLLTDTEVQSAIAGAMLTAARLTPIHSDVKGIAGAPILSRDEVPTAAQVAESVWGYSRD